MGSTRTDELFMGVILCGSEGKSAKRGRIEGVKGTHFQGSGTVVTIVS